jgi:hypothetical protein
MSYVIFNTAPMAIAAEETAWSSVTRFHLLS